MTNGRVLQALVHGAASRGGGTGSRVRRTSRGGLSAVRRSRARRARRCGCADRYRARARCASAARAGRRVPGHLRRAAPSDRGVDCRLGAGDGRTLFLVGDPMQSIYRFRNAEVGLFLDVRDRGLGSVRLERLALGVNFRSTVPIVDWLDHAFPRVLPAHDDVFRGAVAYLPVAASPDAATDGGVRVHALHSPGRLREACDGGRPRRGTPGGNLRGPGRDPGAESQPPGPDRRRARPPQHRIPRDRHRSAGRAAGGARSAVARARALAPGRPRRVAQRPACAVVRADAGRAARARRRCA